jgi:Uncharacterized conserved protein (DUF2190)
MSSGGRYETIPGLVATSTLASYQYYIVQASSTAGEVKLGTSATSLILGVLQNDPGAGEAAEIAFSGIAKAVAEASVTFGSYLTCSSTGRVKSSSTSGNFIIGKALEASAAAGDIISVMLGMNACYG